MAPPTIRKSGKPLTKTERNRRSLAKKKARLQAKRDAAQRSKRIEVTASLGIHQRAIADISDADLASQTVDAVITDPPYAEADCPLYGDLARFAMRVLKPSGWCLVMVGDLYLTRIGSLMTGEGLVERGAARAKDESKIGQGARTDLEHRTDRTKLQMKGASILWTPLVARNK
jgi:hypothetical protein